MENIEYEKNKFEIINSIGKKLIIKNKEREMVIKSKKKYKIGELVLLEKKKRFNNKFLVFINLIPLICFIFGFGFSFFLKNNLLQYMILLSSCVFGYLSLLIIKKYINLLPSIKYIIKNCEEEI